MRRGLLISAVASCLLATAVGCTPVYLGSSVPANTTAPALVQLAAKNGYQAGKHDGALEFYAGRPRDPRAMPMYAETPGYDVNLGPFDVYQNQFRLGYLRGYDEAMRKQQRATSGSRY